MDVKVGDYAMLRGMTVRIEEQFASGRFGIEYVSNYEKGVGITCGGHSFSWGPEDFSPVVDVEAILLCRAYEAKRLIAAARADIVRHEEDFAAQVAAMAAVKAAKCAVTPDKGAV